MTSDMSVNECSGTFMCDCGAECYFDCELDGAYPSFCISCGKEFTVEMSITIKEK